MIEKRGYNQQEAMAYLGIKRRTWDAHFRPKLKAARLGTCLIFDKFDLDALLDQYFSVGGERSDDEKGDTQWENSPESRKNRTGRTVSANGTRVTSFADAASKVMKKRKAGS